MFLKNEQIVLDPLRVLSEDGKFLGIFSRSDALELAVKNQTDLVNINDDVCKLTDYGKFIYSQKKKDKENKQKMPSIKEIQFGINTDIHDLEVKAKKIKKFFEHGDKVKVVLTLRGREKANVDMAFVMMQKFLDMIDSYEIEKELKESATGLMIQLKGTK